MMPRHPAARVPFRIRIGYNISTMYTGDFTFGAIEGGLMATDRSDPLFSVTYLSMSNIPAHCVDMLDIERAALRNNPIDGLTGFLYFDGTFFLQVLEGKRQALDNMLATLAVDPRHGGMRVLRDQPIAARQFGAWSMAFCDGTARHAQFGFRPLKTELKRAQGTDPGDILSRLDALRP